MIWCVEHFVVSDRRNRLCFFFLLVVVVDVSVKSKTHLNVECDEYRIISSVLRLESICVRVLCMKVCDSNE